MYSPIPLSDQQNFAVWVICTFVTSAVLILGSAGLLGFLTRMKGQS